MSYFKLICTTETSDTKEKRNCWSANVENERNVLTSPRCFWVHEISKANKNILGITENYTYKLSLDWPKSKLNTNPQTNFFLCQVCEISHLYFFRLTIVEMALNFRIWL